MQLEPVCFFMKSPCSNAPESLSWQPAIPFSCVCVCAAAANSVTNIVSELPQPYDCCPALIGKDQWRLFERCIGQLINASYCSRQDDQPPMRTERKFFEGCVHLVAWEYLTGRGNKVCPAVQGQGSHLLTEHPQRHAIVLLHMAKLFSICGS